MRYFCLCSAYRITSNIAAMKVKFGMPVAYMVWAEQRAIETIGSTHISHSDMHMNTPDFSVVRKTSFLCLDRLELFSPPPGFRRRLHMLETYALAKTYSSISI